MSGEVRPLPIWPHSVLADTGLMARVKEAKLSLDLDFKVIPCPAVPGGADRVLAFVEVPPFAANTAMVRDATNQDGITAALSRVLQPERGDDGMFTKTDFLKVYLGDVREVTDNG